MVNNTNLYPPIVKTYMPAFLTEGTEEETTCRVYFSLSPYNNSVDIANVQVTVRDQNTNKSMLKKADYPSSVKITSLQEDTSKLVDRFYIEIPETDIQGGWQINKYYRIQIRFTDFEAEAITPGTTQLDTWLSANYTHFSEWSTVCLVRAISTPTLRITGYDIEAGKIVWSLANTQIVGQLEFKDRTEKDILKEYRIRLYDKETDTLLTDSELLTADKYNNVNSFKYTLKYNFIKDKEYYFTVEYTTLSNYSKTETFYFTATEDEDIPDDEFSIIANIDAENGRIGVTVKRASTADSIRGTLVIRRCSSNTDFTVWEDLHSYTYNEPITSIKETWYDTTIESDVWYKYCAQVIDPNQKRGLMKMMKMPVLVSFEDMFLTTKDKQLKIKFNPNVSSFKRTIQESRVDTLGSQYPYIRRNGYMNYVQFPIGGLISFFMDEDELFTSRTELFGKHLNNYANYNDNNRINNQNNYIYERKFRDKVMDFLYDGEPKLFRSPTEGNFVVKVMDVSLTPETQLGRYIYSFSGTAYEIAGATPEDLQKLNIIEGNGLNE